MVMPKQLKLIKVRPVAYYKTVCYNQIILFLSGIQQLLFRQPLHQYSNFHSNHANYLIYFEYPHQTKTVKPCRLRTSNETNNCIYFYECISVHGK